MSSETILICYDGSESAEHSGRPVLIVPPRDERH